MITENLQILKNSTLAIKQAIIDKGGEINGDISTWDDSINKLSLNSEGCSDNFLLNKKDVNFYDYDGTILYSYTKDEFIALSELPKLPTKSNLVCVCWTYNLNAAKTFVEEYGKLDIGATYMTDDDKTRLYIRIATEGRMTVPLYFLSVMVSGAPEHKIHIDWGDGNDVQIIDKLSIELTHTYTSIGDYCITITPAFGCKLGLGGATFGDYTTSLNLCIMGSTNNNGKIFCNMLQKIEIGSDASYNCDYVFNNCYSLNSITIPQNISSIGTSMFHNCYSLNFITIPTNTISIKDSAFYNCYSLSSVVIPSSVTSIETNAFYNCYSLNSIIIPSGMTSIGEYAFNNCYSLSSIIIPSSVSNIASYAFNNCYGMAYYDFSNHTSIPALGSSAFSGISSDCKIIVPDSLYDTWKTATNWSTYANKIIKKSEQTK